MRCPSWLRKWAFWLNDVSERQWFGCVYGHRLNWDDVCIGNLDGLDVPVAAEVLAKNRIIGLADFAFDVLEFFGEGEAQHGQHTFQWIVKIGNEGEEVAAVKIVPVFEVGYGLQKVGGKRDTHGGNILDADHALKDSHERLEFA